MAKRCPCDSKPLTAAEQKALAGDSAKPPQVEIDGAAPKAFGAEGTSAFFGPGAPSAEAGSPEDLSAPDVSVRLVTSGFPEGEVCIGEFIGTDGRRYRQMRRKRGGGYLDWSEPAD